jgi:lysyl-tRNA synthetase class I
MVFLLFDPIFWINKTLATFDRMVNRLTKQVEKAEKEIVKNKAKVATAYAIKAKKSEVKIEKREAKLAKVTGKATTKLNKIAAKAARKDMAFSYRNDALKIAKKRAANTAKNINKMMGE